MGKTRVSRRGVRGGKRLEVNQYRDLLAKTPQTTSLGVVRKFPGEDSHFEIDTENGTAEILVDVELIPSQARVLCRLGFGGDGVYSIPREGQEVAVLIPYDTSSLIKDSLDFEPIIVGVLDLHVPANVDGDDIVVISKTRVRVLSDDIELGNSPAAQDGVVVGTGIDSFTGSTYFALGSTSGKVKAKK